LASFCLSIVSCAFWRIKLSVISVESARYS
jgi:hypothetical protein